MKRTNRFARRIIEAMVLMVGANIDIFLKLLDVLWSNPENLPKVPNLDTSGLEPDKIIY